MPNIWTSEAIRPTANTCVDVHADADAVVLGQLGDVWSHDIRFTPAEARAVARALIQGADHSEAAQRG
jgi:hypothetical protein